VLLLLLLLLLLLQEWIKWPTYRAGKLTPA
jgi:hypothetical protein